MAQAVMDAPIADAAAAVPPSIPYSASATTPRASRSQSRARRISPPPKSRSRYATPNDILMNPASPDVISDLLASFPVINLPEPPGPPPTLRSPISRTPARSTRHSSKAPTPRLSISPSRAPPSSTHRFDEEIQHPVEDLAELQPEEDAAEPPVVRTSRPPSGLTKKPIKRTKERYSPSPRPILSPPPDTARPVLAASRNASALPSGYQTPSYAVGSSRASLESTRSRESFQQRFRRLTGRRKGRDLYSPDGSSLRAAANDSQRAGVASSTIQTPVYRSVIHSARLSEDDAEDQLTNGTSSHILQVVPEQEPTYVRRDDYLDALNYSSNNRSAQKQQDLETLSPVRRTSPTGTAPDKATLNYSEEDIPPTDGTEPQEAIADSGDNETDVMKRIRELKAAREERRKSWKDQSFTTPSEVTQPIENGPVSPLQGTPPTSALADKQLEEAEATEERTISNESTSEKDPYILDAQPNGLGLNNVVRTKSPGLQIRKERAFIVESGISTARSTARPSLDVPSFSYPSPRSEHRSPGASPMLPPSSPLNGHRKNRFSLTRSSPVLDDGPTNIDSINASIREFLSSPRLSQQVPFPADGRKITFSEVGDPNGYVVFCCVGMGMTRYIMAYYDELATSLKLRLITPDRPGIGGSEPYTDESESPYNWPDDIQVICAKLGITKFSILAHSAGVIYALATALRMSQFLRGKLHLLAPWIPPSQLINPNPTQTSASPSGALPRSQRFLRMLPTSFLKLSNSTLAGMSRNNSPKPSVGRARKSSEGAAIASPRPSYNPQASNPVAPRMAPKANTRPPTPRLEDVMQTESDQDFAAFMLSKGKWDSSDPKQRRQRYDAALTPAIWELATRNANPAVDLIICLERTRPIGFRYADVGSKPPQKVHEGFVDEPGSQWPGYGLVIHHGSKDTRVPVENAKWLGKVMPKAEVRILEGQGHGLMASAGVMSGVLTEIGKDWEASNWV